MILSEKIKWLKQNSEHIVELSQDSENKYLLTLKLKLTVFFSTKTAILNHDGQRELVFEIIVNHDGEVKKVFYIQHNSEEYLFHPYIEIKDDFTTLNEKYLWWEKKTYSKVCILDFIIKLMHILVLDPKFYSDNGTKVEKIIENLTNEKGKEILPLEKNICLQNTFKKDTKITFNKVIKEDISNESIPIEAIVNTSKTLIMETSLEKDIEPENKTSISNQNIEKPKKKKIRFKIESATEKYSPEALSFEKFMSDYIIEEINERRDMNYNYSLYTTQKAWTEIAEHIGWNKHNVQFNRVEQGGLLIGRVYKDEEKIFGVVTQTISGDLAQGSSTYLDMGHDVWKKMLDKKDELLKEDDKLHVIGWYHTHPNNLSVFMSGTDMNTQNTMFPENWHFAMVINPHQKVWKVFQGDACKVVNAYRIKKK